MHVRQHSGEKPYACDECEYRTGDHNSLRRHKRRHTGTKPYQCDHCAFSSIQSANFRAHMKRKHAGVAAAAAPLRRHGLEVEGGGGGRRGSTGNRSPTNQVSGIQMNLLIYVY
jgi:hypothetical protein